MAGTGDTFSRQRVYRVAAATLVLVLALLAWQFFAARQARQERDGVRLELTLERLATELALATIEASYGSYEGARELMSSFFTGLQQNIDRAPPEAMPAMAAMLDRRDRVITTLSRRDPESAEMLARMFFRYRAALGAPARPELLPAPPPGAPARDTVDG